MTIQVIRTSDEPIPAWSDALLERPGAIGEIVVQGPVVSREYYGRPEATRLAKIPVGGGREPPVEFFHRMGDLGYFDGQGRLWFCGRKSQRVETPRGTLYTIPCEAVFNTHPAVLRTALVGVGRNGSARPVLCVELRKNSSASPDELKRELLELGSSQPHTKEIQAILFHPGFPVDIRHNAKIGREELARWAARRLP
jgi:acyl-CoA synthetase (AMP-forming)/AMP-acid ligase II